MECVAVFTHEIAAGLQLLIDGRIVWRERIAARRLGNEKAIALLDLQACENLCMRAGYPFAECRAASGEAKAIPASPRFVAALNLSFDVLACGDHREARCLARGEAGRHAFDTLVVIRMHEHAD